MFKKCIYEEKYCYGLLNKILYVLFMYVFFFSVVLLIVNIICYIFINDFIMMFKKYLVKCESWLCFKIMNFFLKWILFKYLFFIYVVKYRW